MYTKLTYNNQVSSKISAVIIPKDHTFSVTATLQRKLKEQYLFIAVKNQNNSFDPVLQVIAFAPLQYFHVAQLTIQIPKHSLGL